MTAPLELGLDTFGDVSGGADGDLLSHAQVIRNVVEEAVLADQLGIDFSASASTTAPILRSRRRRWCWPRSPGAPGASGSAPP